MENKMIASSSPHIRSTDTTTSVMLDVLIALIPALIASMYYFGFKAMLVVALSVGSAVGTEAAIQKLTKKRVTINDLSAVVTGLLLAFNLPVSVPWWIPVIGSAVAIAIGKQVFGGLGNNFINPALAGRAFLVASWPVEMTFWTTPGALTDTIAAATPLAMLKTSSPALSPLSDVFLGRIPGCLGETSAILLLLGGAYLIYKKVISWRIPGTYIATVAIIALITNGFDFTGMAYHVFGGGLMIGAIFMATDYSSSPVTPKGKIIFGIGAGVLTMLIRLYSSSAEGVSYSILFMNVATPLIEKYTAPRVFGTGGVKK
ncbi:MAG: RnfABCDGE type electron transport complex subunit D [Tissierellales bacterium]|nr:RnfABCDGE type electron transport complex subunit D [Tissierellales bacterium]MBN2827841.1 RnfABCDGE type electron transport complex subunit D [Tissierellales bacterium]